MSLNISLSLLEADHAALGHQLAKFEKWGVDSFHLDVMDYDYAGDQGFTWRTASAIINNTGLPVEVHFMVRDPLRYIDKFAELRPACMIFQVEASRDSSLCIKEVKEMGIKAGVAIEPSTPVTDITDMLFMCDCVTLMSVVPGQAGSKFDSRVLQKITQLSYIDKNLIIGLDGGVKQTEAVEAFKLGCNQAVIGTALFKSANPPELVRCIKEECEDL